MNDALMPVYSENDPTPCGYLKVEHLYHDYQTRGFFRIGVLPAVRAEKVAFVVSDPARFREVLREATPLSASRGSRHAFEMHEVSLIVEGEAAPRLTAPRVRLTESGDWDLVDGGLVHQHGGVKELPRSRLIVAGAEAGTLHTSLGDGDITLELFEVGKTEGNECE